MRRFFFTILFTAAATAATAAEAPAKQPDFKLGEPGMTISDCLGIKIGLEALDTGYRVIVAQGKPTESAETMHFKLPAAVRDSMSHNIFVLGQVQQEGQAANRRAQLDIMGDHGEAIKDGSREAMVLSERMTQYTARPCTVQLDHIRDVDLDLAHNDIPASILSLLTKIRDK